MYLEHRLKRREENDFEIERIFSTNYHQVFDYFLTMFHKRIERNFHMVRYFHQYSQVNNSLDKIKKEIHKILLDFPNLLLYKMELNINHFRLEYKK
jgi:hypothetical protein